VNKTEQLNIEGKRSGEGFIVHKDVLTNALSRVQAERVHPFDGVTIGRKGFLSYLKALGESNIIKVIPSSGMASESQHTDKNLKVICGSHEAIIPDNAWISDKTPVTFCQIRVSPNVTVYPNLGSIELAEALSKVLPFTSTDESKPILHAVLFKQSGNKLTLASCDGFRLAICELAFEEGENQVIVDTDYFKGLIPAIRKAKRVRLWFENWPDRPNEGNLVIETELVKYRFPSLDGDFPEYQSFIPKDDAIKSTARFDTKQALKAVQSLASLWFDDNTKSGARPIVLSTSKGKLILDTKEERGKAVIEAEVTGEAKSALQAGYAMQAFKACNGMVDLQMGDTMSPILFSINGYKLVQMPMMIGQTNAVSEAEAIAAEADEKAQTESQEPSSEPKETEQPKAKPKSKRKTKSKAKSKAKEPVAV